MFSFLLQDIPLNTPDMEGMTVLQAALEWGPPGEGKEAIVHNLLNSGASPNVQSPGSMYLYPIVAATFMDGVAANSKGQQPMDMLEKELLAAGAWVSVTDGAGNSPLHYAAKYSLYDVSDWLIQAGAKVSQQNSDGKTPLDLAVDGKIIKLLKANGARETAK